MSGTDLPYSGHARSMSYTDQLEAAFAARSPVQTSIPSYYYSGQRMVTSSAIKTAAELAAVRMPFEPPTTVTQPILPAQAPVSRMSRIIHGVRILMDKKDRSHVNPKAKETLIKQGTHPGPSKLLGVPKSVQAIVYTDFAARSPSLQAAHHPSARRRMSLHHEHAFACPPLGILPRGSVISHNLRRGLHPWRRLLDSRSREYQVQQPSATLN